MKMHTYFDNTKKLLLALIIALACSLPDARAFQFKHISMSDGLSQLSVLSIYQDRLGRMWFGTEEGLNVYDGNNVVAIKSFKGITAPGSLNIPQITGDPDGNIYFMLGTSVVCCAYNTQAYTTLVSSGATAIAYHNGSLLYAQKGTLYSYDTHTKHTKKIRTLPSSRINAIIADRRQQLWIGTTDGLYTMPHGGATVRHAISQGNIEYLYCDSRHNIWASSHDSGLYLLQPDGTTRHFAEAPDQSWRGNYNFSDTETRTQSNISSNLVRSVAEDDNGNIWIGTFMGLNMYDTRTHQFTVYYHTFNPGSLSHSSVFPIVKDRTGTMWIGTYFGGINYFNPRNDTFNYYTADINRSRCLSHPFVGHMVADGNGSLWVCTEGGGLNRIDLHTGSISHYIMGMGSNSIAQNNLKCIALDRYRNRLYIGTHLGGLSILDIATMRFTNLNRVHPEYNRLYGDKISDVAVWRGKVVFASSNGVWLLDPDTYRVEPLLPGARMSGFVYFHIDRNDNIWISVSNVIYRALLHRRTVARTYRCGTHGLQTSQLGKIAEDSHGNIYVTSYGAGLYTYNPQSDTFDSYTTQNSGIPSNFCYEVISQGNLIIFNTDRGLGFLDTRSGEWSNTLFSKEFPLTGIRDGCGLYALGHTVFAGGTNGMVSFSTDKLFSPKTGEHLYVSRIIVNDQDCVPDDGTDIINRAAYLTPDVRLNHDQANLTVWFASDRYADGLAHAMYEYRLKGYNDEWTTTSYRRINYPKLPAGKYVLEVRAKDERGTTGGKGGTLRMSVTVQPPLYLSGYAYTLYILLAVGLVLAAYHVKRKQLLLETSLAFEKKDKENRDALNRAKLQFFTSISHEFRTPLTLIISKIDSLMATLSHGSDTYRRLRSINDNARQMTELINELMDFRKMEQGHTQLHVARHDLVEFARNIAADFDRIAMTRSIDYKFCPTAATAECWFDRTQMQKVVYNLLSNAFKYVKDGTGTIEVHVEDAADCAVLRVADNSSGIAQKDIEHIFDRFYQAGNAAADTSGIQGTGIGLALVKSIVEHHHGKVGVVSKPGYGSIFMVRLPKDSALFTPEELRCDTCDIETAAMPTHILPAGDTAADTPQLPHGGDTPQPAHADDGSRQKVLLVEDNAELLGTLRQLFEPLFDVSTARDGAEECDMAYRIMPDIIVSDIMMPVKSGTEMCKTLKNDIQTSHIPILLLTAMGTSEQEVDGLRCGADDYMAKPFNPNVLIARCNALLRMRNMLKQKFAGSGATIAEAKEFATNQLDRKFIEQCDTFINEHIADSDFSVNDIARAMTMSRTCFFEKFKALTSMTPNEYITTQRLTRAARMLKDDPSLSIADVTYSLGFSTPRYFSQAFKKFYGSSPTEWRQKEG